MIHLLRLKYTLHPEAFPRSQYAVSTWWKCRFLVLEVSFPQLVDPGHHDWCPGSMNMATKVNYIKLKTTSYNG